MNFLYALNDTLRRLPLNKTKLYQSIAQARPLFESHNINVHLRNELDVFGLEIVLRAFNNKRIIDESYDLFCFEHSDISDYLTYAQKRDAFNAYIKEIVVDLPHFFDEESQMDIYVPVYEPFLNDYLINDYQLTRLRQHREYMRLADLTAKTPWQRYGSIVYDSAFSSLVNVWENDRHKDYYFDEMQIVLMFDKDTFELDNILTLSDGTGHRVTSTDARILTTVFEQERYDEALTLMHNLHFIGDHNYQKLMNILERG